MEKLIDILLPQELQEGTESYVGKWLKQPGDWVELHEPLLEVNSDKAIVEVPSPTAGILKKIFKKADAKIELGEVLGHLEATGAGEEKASRLSPAVRRLLQEKNLDPHQIIGTGSSGRITHQDVIDYLAARGGEEKGRIPSRCVPHKPIRRKIASNMVRSVSQAPHVTALFEADMSEVIQHRNKNKEAFAAKGIALTFTSYFIHAAVKALKKVPEVNSQWHDDFLEIFEDYNIGVGTALEDQGLIVPVIHQAQQLDLLGIAAKLQELTEKARGVGLQPKDLQDGTFTISNHGVTGSLLASPIIIHQMQSAILGIGKMEKRAVVREQNGEEVIEARPMAYVTLTIDHRSLDAYHANTFLQVFVKTLVEVSSL